MQAGQPSRTAWAAAVHRAVHQLVEGGRIFADRYAVTITGADPAALVEDADDHPDRRAMRLFIAVRTRIAEEAVAAAVEGGGRQLVVLGAGLDTFALRSPYGDRLRVLEVDHPATQAWKRERLADAGLQPPPWLTFAPVDFEREALADGLARAGFDPHTPSVFTWLGVTPCLTREAIFDTLRFIAAAPGGSGVAFDYADPPHTLAPQRRAAFERRAARVEALGEPWISFFEAQVLADDLWATGFPEIEDFGPREIAARFWPGYAAIAPERGGHVIVARRPPRGDV